MLQPRSVSRFSNPNKQGILVVKAQPIVQPLAAPHVDCNICYENANQNNGCPTHPVCNDCLCKLEDSTCPICRQQIPVTEVNKQVMELIELKKAINKYINIIADNFLSYYLQYRPDDGTDTYKLTNFVVNNFFLLATLHFNQPQITQSDIINTLMSNQESLLKFYELVMMYWDQVKLQA